MTIKRILIKTKTKTKTMTSPIEISTRRGWFQIFSEIHLFVPTTWNWIACKMERKVSANLVWLNLKKIFSLYAIRISHLSFRAFLFNIKVHVFSQNLHKNLLRSFHEKYAGHHYFLSWRESWTKFEDWDWFNARNYCRWGK